MLDNVEYDAITNTLTFTWNTAAGQKTDIVVLSDIVPDTNTVTTLIEGDNITITDSGVNGNHNYTVSSKDWSNEIASALSQAKDYADENDANNNTAHSHVDGIGVKVTGADNVIEGEVKIDLDVKFNEKLGEKDSKKYLQILDATNNNLITEFDISELISNIYTGKTGQDITIEIDKNNIISATLNESFFETKELKNYKPK
jgi:hypothetical protein